jgi:hypothetical protein
MKEMPPAALTPGRTPRPVLWVLGVFSLVVLIVGIYVWHVLVGGLAPHDDKPHGAETRSAVQAAERTAHALEEVDRDGTLTEPEARSAVARGGVLTELSLGDDWSFLTVAFPYTVMPLSADGRSRRYVCVYFVVHSGKSVETRYPGGCPAHPHPFTSPTPGAR